MGGFLSTVSQTIGHEFDPFNINNKATFFFLLWRETKKPHIAPFLFMLMIKDFWLWHAYYKLLINFFSWVNLFNLLSKKLRKVSSIEI